MRRRAVAAAGFALFAAVFPVAVAAADRAAGATAVFPVATGAPWTAAERASLQRDIDALLLTAPALRGAHAGLLLADARGGAPLYERAVHDAFVPASTYKLLTGSAVLDAVGPDYRLQSTASVRNAGSGQELVVRGGGDVLLGYADLTGLSVALQNAGIVALPGSVTVDGGRYADGPFPDGWSIDDMPYDYAAPVSAAAFAHNAVHIIVTAAATAGAVATVRVASPIPDLVRLCAPDCRPSLEPAIDARVTTGVAGSADTVEAMRTRDGTTSLRGSIPLGAQPDELDLAVPDGAAYLRRAIVQQLNASNIAVAPLASVAEAAPAAAVWMHDSEPLRDLLADCWQPSDNLLAEVLLHELGIAASGLPGTTAKGTSALVKWLRGVGADPATLALADGSGLSAYDRLTPAALVAVLRHDWNGPYRTIVLDALPVAGVRGTLASSFAAPPLAGRVFAKTGTVSHASALAGYLATRRHGTVLFAFLVDDWVGSSAAALRELRARVLARVIAT